MPWKECTYMSLRREFVNLARSPDANVSELCRRFGVSRKTGYKWLGRFASHGPEGLKDRSRRPRTSPRRTVPETEARIQSLRQDHEAWGPRKLRRALQRQGVESVPAASTITGILARKGLLRPDRRLQRDWQRFEAEAPNELLQMDFKGHVPAGRQRCHPLTIIDDHSRFSLCIAACTDERRETVQTQLTRVFERYGLPERILTDNGSPWGSAGQGDHTRLTAWLIRLGIGVSHGRPHHPETRGKNERFHRTLVAEVLSRKAVWRDIDELQQAFDAWRDVYNFERPHDALGLDVPASRYRPSPRPFPSALPPVEYECGAEVRKVRDTGQIKFGGRLWFVGKAFYGEPVAIRPVAADAWDVYYCRQVIAHLDLTTRGEV